MVKTYPCSEEILGRKQEIGSKNGKAYELCDGRNVGENEP